MRAYLERFLDDYSKTERDTFWVQTPLEGVRAPRASVGS